MMPLFQQKRKTKHSVEGFSLSPNTEALASCPHALCWVWTFWQSLCLLLECVCLLMAT